MAESNNDLDGEIDWATGEPGVHTDDASVPLLAAVASTRAGLTGDPPSAAQTTTPKFGSIIGTILDETYRIDRLLAGGGCGDVYVATHLRLGSQVAVKVLHPSLAGNAQALARLQREADVMSTLRHPHVVQILDFNVTADGVPFLVMELLEGWPLTGRTVSGPPFEPGAAVHIVGQIAQALAAAHAHGIVHMDLKPDNVILVRTDGRGDFVKVIDFGISQAIWRERLAADPVISGTPEYMAPEQAGGMVEEIDHRADQFSLASLTYRLLTGHEPFSGADPFAILHEVISGTPQRPSQRVPSLGGGVDEVILRGMSKLPADRYPDIAGFADALRAAVELIPLCSRPSLRPLSESVANGVAPPAEFSRKKKGAIVRSMSRIVRVGVLAVAAVWLFPSTGTVARATWNRATVHARRVLVAVQSNDQAPLRW